MDKTARKLASDALGELYFESLRIKERKESNSVGSNLDKRTVRRRSDRAAGLRSLTLRAAALLHGDTEVPKLVAATFGPAIVK